MELESILSNSDGHSDRLALCLWWNFARKTDPPSANIELCIAKLILLE
jgi:hypothetical protein